MRARSLYIGMTRPCFDLTLPAIAYYIQLFDIPAFERWQANNYFPPHCTLNRENLPATILGTLALIVTFA